MTAKNVNLDGPTALGRQEICGPTLRSLPILPFHGYVRLCAVMCAFFSREIFPIFAKSAGHPLSVASAGHFLVVNRGKSRCFAPSRANFHARIVPSLRRTSRAPRPTGFVDFIDRNPRISYACATMNVLVCDPISP